MQSLSPELYSSQYLDSIKDRFPEFSDYTKDELVMILKGNADRKIGIYEYEIQSALKDLDDEVVLDDDQNILDNIPSDMSDRVNSGLSYIIKNNKGSGDLVLNIRQKTAKPTGGWEAASGSLTFPEMFSFVVDSKHADSLSPAKISKLVLVLSVKPLSHKDSLGRYMFSLSPKLIEIPSTNSLLMKNVLFQQDLTTQEFKEELQKMAS